MGIVQKVEEQASSFGQVQKVHQEPGQTFHTVDIVVLIKDPSYFKFQDPQSNLYNINEHCRICPQLNIFVATMLDVSAQELKNQDVEMEEN